MKSAATYYKTHLQSAGWSSLEYLPNDYLKAFETVVAAIAADARADALAESKAAPDEERAKREYERFQSFFPSSRKVAFEEREAEARAAWIAYVKTLPPRPVRSPEERLFSTLQNLGHLRAYESWDHYSRGNPHSSLLLIAEATALGIKPQE